MLNLAAFVFEKFVPTLSCSFCVAALLLASPVAALDGIDLSAAAEPVAEGDCPALIQIKYPFLVCGSGEIGQSDADELWDATRRIPIMSDWTEGDGAWGPSLNVD